MSTFKSLYTAHAPEPIGIYSQATQIGNLIFLSGQIGLMPSQGELVAGGCQRQLEQIFRNIEAILAVKNASLAQIVKLTIYLKDISDSYLVNELMRSYFAAPYPARAVVQVAELPRNALIEIEAIAAL